MGIVLSDNIQANAPKSIDSRYLNNLVPYTSVSAANAAILSGVRYTGLTVNILGTEYWYGQGILDSCLVTKSAGGSWGSISGVLSGQTDLQTCLNGKLASGGTAVCATTAGNSLCLGGQLPAYYLNTGSTITASCAADSAKLNNKLPAYYLNTGSTSINSLALCGCTPACFLGATATACCAVTAGNALCLNGHLEANLSVNNSACLGGALASTYAPVLDPSFFDKIVIFSNTTANNNRIWLSTGNNSAAKIYTDFSGSNTEQPLILGTWNNNADQLTLATSGYVGIGTTTPYEKLDVNGSIKMGHYTTSGTRFIGYTNNVLGGIYAGISIESTTLGGNYSQKLNFSTHHYGGNTGVRMTIDEDGNVGIGTATPYAKLNIKQSGEDYTGGLSLERSDNANTWQWINGGNSNLYLGYAADPTAAGNFVSKMVVQNGGNVGIGTAAPSQPLHVIGANSLPATTGTVQTGTARFSNAGTSTVDIGSYNSTGAGWIQATDVANLSANYNLLLNPNGGNIGIGTTTPSSRLEVSATNVNTDLTAIRITNTAGNTYALTSGIKLANEYGFSIRNITDGTTPFTILSNDDIIASGKITSSLLIVPFVGSGTANTPVYTPILTSYLDTRAQTTISVGSSGMADWGGWFKFTVNSRSNPSTPTDVLTITPDGNVGIGTTSPDTRLHIRKDSVGGDGGRITVENYTYPSGTESKVGLTMHFGVQGRDSQINAYSSNGGYGYTGRIGIGMISTVDDVYYERLSINNGGFVGIGTTTPYSKLNVEGGNVQIGGGTYGSVSKLSIYDSDATLPPTSGTAPFGGIHIGTQVNGVMLNMGINAVSPYGAWIQVTNATTRSANYNLLLNPNGGNVGIGCTAPSVALDVCGSIKASSNVIAGCGCGFQNNGFIANVPNPIWAIGGFTAYGMAYYQGTALAGGDAVGFHFGCVATPKVSINCSGNIVASGCGTAIDWIATSSIKIKTDISPISNALSTISQLQGICYKLCADESNKCRIGLIAEHVLPILPSVVHCDTNGDVSGISYDKIVALLISGMQEQQLQTKKLMKEMRKLKEDFNCFKKHNNE